MLFVQADKLERLRERMVKVRDLFRDTDSTEFVIVTIPTVVPFYCISALNFNIELFTVVYMDFSFHHIRLQR